MLSARQKQSVFHRLAARAQMDDLEQHLKCEINRTPRDWAGRYNLAKGAAFGLSHSFL